MFFVYSDNLTILASWWIKSLFNYNISSFPFELSAIKSQYLLDVLQTEPFLFLSLASLQNQALLTQTLLRSSRPTHERVFFPIGNHSWTFLLSSDLIKDIERLFLVPYMQFIPGIVKHFFNQPFAN